LCCQQARSDEEPPVAEVRILATCSLGLGFSYKGFQAGLALEPHAIACDAGSSDYGPFFLGSGKVQKAPAAIEREFTTLLKGARDVGAPFITGSVGGAGDNPHVREIAALARRIADANALKFRMAEIEASVSPDFLRRKLARNEIAPAGPGPALTEDIIAKLAAAVAQMGVDPFLRALETGVDLILAGRATDPAIFAGVPLRRGVAPAQAWHAGKLIDKGYLATTRPQDGSPILARIEGDAFTIEPTREGSRCTVNTVSSMMLYENTNPFVIPQPEGAIDASEATYEQIDDRRVRVTGSRFQPASQLTVKIEGTQLVGHRAVMFAGIRDPRLIARLDELLAAYEATMARVARGQEISEQQYSLKFRVYGRDAVMGEHDPERGAVGHEIGLLVDLIAQTPEICTALAARLAPTGSRLGLDDGIVGGGNFAFPFSPATLTAGPVYEWTVWHIAKLTEAEMTELFPIRVSEIGR
jgi:hypothetical protein